MGYGKEDTETRGQGDALKEEDRGQAERIVKICPLISLMSLISLFPTPHSPLSKLVIGQHDEEYILQPFLKT
jgi:hypothetical protein